MLSSKLKSQIFKIFSYKNTSNFANLQSSGKYTGSPMSVTHIDAKFLKLFYVVGVNHFINMPHNQI